ncbi:MAG TPA: glyoxalase, partial [Salinarimonas sp.]|nr:glyoxalase [Salinarimonas sp.]
MESVLYSDDLPRAVAFYRDELGLELMAGDGERFQALRAGPQVLLLFKRGGTLAPTEVPGGVIP